MKLTTDPALLAPDATFVKLTNVSGATMSYGRSRTSTPTSLTTGNSVVLQGPIWAVSAGPSTEVSVITPHIAAFEWNGTTLFLGSTDPATAALDGDVWIDTT